MRRFRDRRRYSSKHKSHEMAYKRRSDSNTTGLVHRTRDSFLLHQYGFWDYAAEYELPNGTGTSDNRANERAIPGYLLSPSSSVAGKRVGQGWG